MPTLPLFQVFRDLPDPRRTTQNKLHNLNEILLLAPCAIIGGAESWDGIATYTQSKKAFFQRFLALPNGIPSADDAAGTQVENAKFITKNAGE